MKQRAFLTNLAATAALPMVALKSLAAAVPSAAAASIEQPYLWASFISRVHNNASPSMLQRLLKLDENVAQQVYSELINNNVITSPNAYGISRAVNPYPQPGLAHMQGQAASQTVNTSDKPLKLMNITQEEASDDDSPPVLWAFGDISLLQKPSITIVGARNASSLGTRMTRQIVSDLGAEGYVSHQASRGASTRLSTLQR